MMNWPFTFPNANALLDNMQKQHMAGLQRIEGLAALAGSSRGSFSNRGRRPYYPTAVENDDGSVTTLYPFFKEYSGKEIGRIAKKQGISEESVRSNIMLNGDPSSFYDPVPYCKICGSSICHHRRG
jgi:hypothetical protein